MTEMEAAMLQLVDMMREQQVKLDAMHELVMELVKRELKGSYPRHSRNKPMSSQPVRARMKAAAGSAGNTRDGLTDQRLYDGESA